MKNTILAVSALALLTACGGSNAPVIAQITSLPYDGVEELAMSLSDKYDDLLDSGEFAGADDLRANGTAGFAGVVAVGGSGVANGTSEAIVIGQISVLADFENDKLTGTASDFYDIEDESAIGGSASLDADINTGTGMFAGTFEGAFEDTGGVDDDVPFSAYIEGGFAGANGEAVAGSGTGTITFPEDEGGELGFGVVFAAEE